MTYLTNIGNVRTKLKIDPQKKIWSDDTLGRFVNEGQRWVQNMSNVSWSFQETFGYLVPALDYQEYRPSGDDNPENYVSDQIKKFLRAKTSQGNEMAFGRHPDFQNSVATAPSILTEYANRFFINAGYEAAATYTTLHNMDTFDGDGTWVGTNDADTVATDASTYKEGSGSVSFNADVSASTTNTVTLTNPDMASVDIDSVILNNAGVIMWVYFPSSADMRSVEIKFGSDSSNYYSAKQYESDVQGKKYQTGWTRIFIPTINRRTVGTPDMTAVDYLQVNIVFDSSQADATGFRIDNIQIVDKYIRYDYARRSENMTSDSDESTVPSEYQFVYELYAEYKAWSILSGREQKASMAYDEAILARNTMLDEFQYLMPQEYIMPPR